MNDTEYFVKLNKILDLHWRKGYDRWAEVDKWLAENNIRYVKYFEHAKQKIGVPDGLLMDRENALAMILKFDL